MRRRFEKNYLKKRLGRQRHHEMIHFRGGVRVFWENMNYAFPILKLFLRTTGLMSTGLRQSLDYQLVHHSLPVRDLPSPFEGFRILHLSDLHIDGMIDHGRRFFDRLKTLPPYDLCVITGDFRFLTYGQTHEALVATRKMMEYIHCPQVLGILGNHDCVSMVPHLERMGIRMLINESFYIQKKDARLAVVGIDDAYFYETDDLDSAVEDVEAGVPKILLAHCLQNVPKAKQYGFDAYLCGHTHGGQLCLPGGRAFIRHLPGHLPEHYIGGPWQYQGMAGYTSRGVGSSCLTVRYHCPPEIIIHTLKQKPVTEQTETL